MVGPGLEDGDAVSLPAASAAPEPGGGGGEGAGPPEPPAQEPQPAPTKRPATQRNLTSYFGGSRREEHASAGGVAPAQRAASPEPERPPPDATEEGASAKPKRRPRKVAKPAEQTDEDEQGSNSDAPAGKKSGAKPARRRSSTAKPKKAAGTGDDADGAADKESSSKVPPLSQRNIKSFFAKSTAPTASETELQEPAVASALQHPVIALSEDEVAGAPASGMGDLSGLEEEIEEASPVLQDSGTDSERPPRRSPRKRRTRASGGAAPAVQRKRSSRAKKSPTAQPPASGPLGVIDLESDTENDSGTTNELRASSDAVAVPSVPGDRDVLSTTDFFLTPAERIRKKQLLAQKKAREEVERHSKEAAVFARKQIGGEGAAQAGHWFFEKRTALKGDESADSDAGSSFLLKAASAAGREASFPDSSNMHVRGAEPDLGPLTGQFSGFRLRVSNLEPPNVSSGWAPSLQTFDFEGPSNSVRAFPVQHQPLDRVLQLLGEQYGDSAIKQGACARLYDMLASGKRFSPSDGDLWVDRYKPKAAADVLGNTQVVEDLASWMETRKVVLEAAPSHSRNRPGKDKRRQKRSKGRKSKRDINDFIVDSDEDLYSSGEEAESSSSTVLLVGPCGSGKTAMVEAVAAQLGFSILEISEGQKRDSKSVMSEIGEAAVNHTLVGSAAPRERASERPKDSRIAELFAGGGRSGPHQASESGEDEPDIAAMRRKARKRKVVESDSEDEAVPPRAAEPETLSSLTNDFDAEPSPEARKKRRIIRLNLSPDASQPAVHGDDDAKAALAARPASTGQTLLVFDNVDIVYEEDKGFWAAVAAVAERTKRPIVLTANSADFIESLPTSLADDLTVKDTTKPTVEQLAAYLALVCVLEGVWMEKADLIQLVEWCNGEIGRSLRAVELITLAPRSELRGTVTGQPGDSSGFIDLAVCGTAAEFDVTALRWELGQSGWGLLHRETDGVLGVLADVRIEASEPSPSPFREPPVAASVPEEASLSLRGDVEPAEAPNGDVEPAEAKLVSESASPMGQDAPKDAEQPVSPVPAKQTQSDRIRASLLEAYSTETDVISQWDAGINGGGMIRRFLDGLSETVSGDDNNEVGANSAVPNFAIGKPEHFDRLGDCGARHFSYLDETALASETKSLADCAFAASVTPVVGEVQLPAQSVSSLWLEVREQRERDFGRETFYRQTSVTMTSLLRDDALRHSATNVALEIAPFVASILHADQVNIELEAAEGEHRQEKRRVTRQRKLQPQRYFFNLLEEDGIRSFLDTRDTLRQDTCKDYV